MRLSYLLFWFQRETSHLKLRFFLSAWIRPLHFEMRKIHTEIKIKLFQNTFLEILKEICEESKFEYIKDKRKIKDKYYSISLSKKEWQNHCIHFQFRGNDLNNFVYGVIDKRIKVSNIAKEFFKKVEGGYKTKGSWWCLQKNWNGFDDVFFEEIANVQKDGEKLKVFKEKLGKIITDLANAIDDYEKHEKFTKSANL